MRGDSLGRKQSLSLLQVSFHFRTNNCAETRNALQEFLQGVDFFIVFWWVMQGLNLRPLP